MTQWISKQATIALNVLQNPIWSPLRDSKRSLHQATPDIGLKLGSYVTALTEPAITDGKEAALSFMERILAGHNVTYDAAAAAVESRR